MIAAPKFFEFLEANQIALADLDSARNSSQEQSATAGTYSFGVECYFNFRQVSTGSHYLSPKELYP